jgi:hypothetical protein
MFFSELREHVEVNIEPSNIFGHEIIHSKCLRASLPCQCMEHPPSMAFQVTTS